MRSSTSSSKTSHPETSDYVAPERAQCFTSIHAAERVPWGPWLRTWVVALLLAGGFLGGLEVYARRQGHRPTVVDDKALWALKRHRVYDNGDRKPFVVLGASRIQLGFSPSAFETRFADYRVIDLAVLGAHPMATLRDLANDHNFRGVVLCDMSEPYFERRFREQQQPWVNFYHNRYDESWWRDDETNRTLSTYLQQHLAILNPDLRLDRMAVALLRDRRFPSPNWHITHKDRSVSADFSLTDSTGMRDMFIERADHERYVPTPEDWLTEALEVEAMAQQIEARGGRVVFLRMITTGKYYENDIKFYPREKYWDVLAGQTSVAMIHFADVPTLAGFDCPDGSHLDAKDVPAFTIALGEELQRRGVLKTGS